MPRTHADHAVGLMEAAALANSRDPFRTGFLIELPARGDVLVTGDLHGNAGNLRRIVELANLPRYPDRHLVLQELVHGPGDDGEACRSFRLVETAARLKTIFPSQVHVLLGNHEYAELLDLAIGKQGRELNVAFEAGLRAVYGGRWKEVKEAYCRFWRTCPLAVRTANRVFICHSLPRAEKMGELGLDYLRRVSSEEAFHRNSPVFAMLWGRDRRSETAQEFARRMQAEVVIVGHTACKGGLAAPNPWLIILDSKDRDGRYILLPMDRPLTQQEIVALARALYP